MPKILSRNFSKLLRSYIITITEITEITLYIMEEGSQGYQKEN